MEKITPPPQGYDPEQIEGKLASLSKNISEYNDLLKTGFNSVSIVVIDAERKTKIFSFTRDNIPVEVYEFFESSLNRMYSEKYTIETGFNLYKIGNHVVEINNFIKNYTVDKIDIGRMKSIQPGQTCVIVINNIATQIERVS